MVERYQFTFPHLNGVIKQIGHYVALEQAERWVSMGYEVRKHIWAPEPKHPDWGTGLVVIRVDGGIYSMLHIKPPSESLPPHTTKQCFSHFFFCIQLIPHVRTMLLYKWLRVCINIKNPHAHIHCLHCASFHLHILKLWKQCELKNI